MSKNRLRAALLASALAIAAPAAFATSLVQMSFSELVADSDAVVVAEATASRVERTSDGVVTVTTFAVSDPVVGGDVSSVNVVTPGGSFKPGKFRVSESTADTPIFPIGAEQLLFLDQTPGGAYAVVGFSQGAVKIRETASGKTVRLPDSERDESLPEAKSRIRDERRSGRRERGDDTD